MAILNCPDCKKKVSTNAKVCPACGGKGPFSKKSLVLAICPDCKEHVSIKAKTCPTCRRPGPFFKGMAGKIVHGMFCVFFLIMALFLVVSCGVFLSGIGGF